MNKGIKQAHGEYLFFLNSGDTLISNTILQEIALDGNKYIYGNIKYILSEKDYRYITPSETLDIVYLPYFRNNYITLNTKSYQTGYIQWKVLFLTIAAINI